MKNSKAILLSALVVALFSMMMIEGCKKEDDDSNTAADAYVGNWHAMDTVYDAGGAITINGVIDFSIAKKDANNVYLISFLLGGDTVAFSATPTTLVHSSGGGTYISWYSNLVMTLSGNKLYYTHPVGSGVNSGTATKQ